MSTKERVKMFLMHLQVDSVERYEYLTNQKGIFISSKKSHGTLDLSGTI